MEKTNPLSEEEKRVIIGKGTEPPFSGKYLDHSEKGAYVCRRCGAPLFLSESKFESGCGWPSFDAEIPGAVVRKKDPDGVRTEIVCAACSGHLGHVFTGENMTPADTRHCVNSLSLQFAPEGKYEKAVFAGGCFWGVEALFQEAEGVVSARSGYTGGEAPNPTYEQVLSGGTGHYEAVQIIFDAAKTSYEEMLKLFFQIHDFSQEDGQGPDVGSQYLSAVFYESEEQKESALRLIDHLRKMGYSVSTRVLPAAEFHPAEEYHQKYYEKTGKAPYCHYFRKVF